LFYTHTATTQIYTLSLHDALPILFGRPLDNFPSADEFAGKRVPDDELHEGPGGAGGDEQGQADVQPAHGRIIRCGCRRALRLGRSEEHTSELQSLAYLVCRLLLEK